jgi:hypothetical protein
MENFKIVENAHGSFNIKKRTLLFFWKYLSHPKYPNVIWHSKTRRGAQAYINLLAKNKS